MGLEHGAKLGNFEILESIGAGGMGEVYRARDSKLDRNVAIKVLAEDLATDPSLIARFKREAKVLASLDHPNIGALYDFQEDEGVHFLVMQLVEGETLWNRMKRGPIPLKEALPIFIQIAQALDAAHGKGIVHRDVKPENVKIGEDGRVKLLDFGIARPGSAMSATSATDATRLAGTDSEEFTTAGLILGTPAYMSPEQARGLEVDQRSDIWAFGCCLYEAITGTVTFDGMTPVDTIAAIIEREPDWDRLSEGLPETVRVLIRSCLEKDQNRRLSSARDLAIQLEESLRAPEGEDERGAEVAVERLRAWRPEVGGTIPGRPHWLIESKIGEGGFGQVWLAAHERTKSKRVFKFCFDKKRVRSLNREVVLFRLLRETLGTRTDIAQIIDWQFDELPYYLESEYTEGGDLGAWAESQGGLDKIDLETRIDLVAQVADALGAAHGVGVIHKDVKPGNILIADVAAGGRPRAVLMDFGIGLILDPGALAERGITAYGFTQTNSTRGGTSASGTWMYMAPEVIEGRHPTTRSDVYSLGVLLYQMVIGDFMRSMAPGWEHEVDSELLREDILACVQGQAEHRMSSAVELASRLRSLREREEERKQSREQGRLAERAKRLRRQLVISGAGALVVVIVATAISVFEYQRAERERSLKQDAVASGLAETRAKATAQQALAEVERQKEQLEETLYTSQIVLAAMHLGQHKLGFAKAALKGAPASLRAWEWGYLVNEAFSEELAGDHSEDLVWNPELSTALNWIGKDSMEVHSFTGHSTAVQSIDFDRPGRRVLTGSSDGKAVLWSVETGKDLQTFTEGREVEWNARISPDGLTVMSTRPWDRSSRIWDIETGRVLQVLEGGHTEPIEVTRFSPDGTRVATGSMDGTTRIWDTNSGVTRQVLQGHTSGVTDLRFTDSGKHLLAASTDGNVRTWLYETGALVKTVSGPSSNDIVHVQLSRSSRLAITTTSKGQSFVWQTSDGALVCTLDNREGLRNYGDFSPDESCIVLPSVEQGADIWSIPDGMLIARIGHNYGRVLNSIFDDAGRYVFTGANSGSVKMWSPSPPQDRTLLRGHTDTAYYMEFSHDGKRLITAGYDGAAIVWDVDSRTMLARLEGHGEELRFAMFSPSGDRIITGTWTGQLKFWHGQSYKELPAPFESERPSSQGMGGPRSEYNLAIAALLPPVITSDGELILSRHSDGSYAVHSMHSGELISSFREHKPPLSASTLSPDATRAATSTFQGEIWIWELRTGKPLFKLEGHRGAITMVSYSPDGSRIVTSSLDQTARIWDAETGVLIHILKGHRSIVTTTGFSSDGSLIATSSGDNTVALWDAYTGNRLQVLEGLPTSANGVAFNPKGNRVLAFSQEAVAIWDTSGRKLIDLPSTMVSDQSLSLVSLARWSPTGEHVSVCYRDGAVRLFSALDWSDLGAFGDDDTRLEDRIALWRQTSSKPRITSED